MRTICHDHFILSDSLYYALHLPVIPLFRPTFYSELFLKLSIYVLPFRRMRDEVLTPI
jgi:hypothetical protein